MFFKKKKTDNSYQDSESNSNFISKIEILLTPEYELEIQLELKDIDIKNETESIDKAQKLAEFLFTINSGELKYNLTKMLVDQIGTDEKTQKFVEYIVLYWTVLEKKHNDSIKEKSIDTPVISPTKVFGKYITRD